MQCVGAQIVAGRWPPPAAACRTCCLLAPHVTPGSHHRGADAQRSWVALIEKGLDFEIRKVGVGHLQGTPLTVLWTIRQQLQLRVRTASIEQQPPTARCTASILPTSTCAGGPAEQGCRVCVHVPLDQSR